MANEVIVEATGGQCGTDEAAKEDAEVVLRERMQNAGVRQIADIDLHPLLLCHGPRRVYQYKAKVRAV